METLTNKQNSSQQCTWKDRIFLDVDKSLFEMPLFFLFLKKFLIMRFCVGQFCCFLFCFGQGLPTQYSGLLLLAQMRKDLYDRLKAQECVAQEALI